MAEHRDESGQGQAGKSAQSKKPTQSSGAAEPGAASERTSATVVRRKQRYLIGFRSLPGIMPAPADPFLEKVSQTEGVEIIRRLPMSGSPQARAETMVVRMDEQRGEALRLNAPPHIIVELDAPLDYSDMIVPEPISDRLAVQAIPFTRPRRELLFRVVRIPIPSPSRCPNHSLTLRNSPNSGGSRGTGPPPDVAFSIPFILRTKRRRSRSMSPACLVKR